MRRTGAGEDARLLVELVGAPGSGKSTLAAALAARPGIAVVSGVRRLADYGILADAWLRAPSVRGVADHPLRVRRWAARVEAFDRLVSRRVPSGSTAVVDQGPVYSLARIRAAVGQDPRWTSWWRSHLIAVAGSVQLVVLLDAPDDVLLARIHARDKDHAAKHLTGEEALAHVRGWRRSLTSVTAELLAAGPVRVVRASTSVDGPPAVVDEVLAQLALTRLPSL